MQIEQLFQDLFKLARTLTDEEARHVREQLSEEELVVFDLLTRPGPDLTTEECNEVKKVARQLLAKAAEHLHAGLAEDHSVSCSRPTRHRGDARRRPAARLHAEVYRAKASLVFQHFYERAA